MDITTDPGAQTGRPRAAKLVSALLGGENSPAAFLDPKEWERSIY
jgi:hypothetical protein